MYSTYHISLSMAGDKSGAANKLHHSEQFDGCTAPCGENYIKLENCTTPFRREKNKRKMKKKKKKRKTYQ